MLSGCGDVPVTEQMLHDAIGAHDTEPSEDLNHVVNESNRPIRLQVYYVEPAGPHQGLTPQQYAATLKDIDRIVKESQAFFAREMQHHGYGPKTFDVITNPDGAVATERIVLEHPLSYYDNDAYQVDNELFLKYQGFATRRINVFFVDMVGSPCGLGSGSDSGGNAMLMRECWKANILSHELAHAIELHHDRRNGVTDFTVNGETISAEAAAWLNRHHALNRTSFPSMESPGYFKQFVTPLDLNDLRFEIGFKFHAEHTTEDLALRLTYDYAMMFNRAGPGDNEVIAFTDDISLKHEHAQHEEDSTTVVYTLDFNGNLPTGKQEVGFILMGKYGQIFSVNTIEVHR